MPVQTANTNTATFLRTRMTINRWVGMCQGTESHTDQHLDRNAPTDSIPAGEMELRRTSRQWATHSAD